MSVAMGIAHPREGIAPPFVRAYSEAGTIMPPMAAAMGMAAWRVDANSPASTSRLISSPTRRKKMAIRPSLIHWCRVSDDA